MVTLDRTGAPTNVRFPVMNFISTLFSIGVLFAAPALLQTSINTFALADDLSGRIGHYEGPPSYYDHTNGHPDTRYQYLKGYSKRCDTHGCGYWGIWEGGHTTHLPPDFNPSYFKAGSAPAKETTRTTLRITSIPPSELNKSIWTQGSYGGSGIAHQSSLIAYRGTPEEGYKGLWWNSREGMYNEAPLPRDFDPSRWNVGKGPL